MVNVSFPGLGIGEFSFNKVAFTIPIGSGVEVRWYGIIITVGIILGLLYASFRAKHEGISFDDLLDITIFTVIFAIIGARLYYVIFSNDTYETFYDVIAIWNGGIAIYGAIIAGALTIIAVCKYKKIKMLKALDMAAPAVMIGQIIGRWGNFTNGEAYGYAVKESEFLYFMRMGLSKGSAPIQNFVHPTFLYESLWNLVGFLIINALYKKKKFDGQILLMYLTWYGFGRMFIEGLRTDSLPLGIFRVSQIVGFVCFAAGLILLIVFLEKARHKELSGRAYESVYSKAFAANTNDETAESAEKTEQVEQEVEEKVVADSDISDKLRNLFDDEDEKKGEE